MRNDEDEARRQFSEYFAARRETVRHAAYLMSGDWHWADDLTQAAFIRVASAWHRIRDPQALDAFVRTCLVRVYLSETRRVWRRHERPVAEMPDLAGGDDDAESAARRVVIAQALRQLPPRRRVTLVCRFYQGLDVAETAAALGCSEGTVKSQTARGLATLRKILNDSRLAPAPACAMEERA
ncbi:RNA polymerase sigma-70 factor, sigma-E family [Micromonospora echinaurantiaca]|uniref:RNA polymerase sigma-70 factor, sigma-E family n=1 Tax=Micromonospora echinaurantiaca TaxID=47857 RepID=A0A1C5IID5_9ACTN|nr:SigE family RNA polymerase sigma factor [Micromonospora echinaurantiaca]SCG57781.1 RNA polymerase sigma-70 factor, sigma-E family [Micromonospora echinaurantiaca]